jgi:hypothetical protein
MKTSANPGNACSARAPAAHAPPMTSVTGKPSRACSIDGASTSASGKRPKRVCSSHQPSTAPGTLTASAPRSGIRSTSSSSSRSSVNDSGERPLAFRPCSRSFAASQTMANRSPPMPQLVGSMRPSAAFAAIAASTALPRRAA